MLYKRSGQRKVVDIYHGCKCGNRVWYVGYPTFREKVLLWLRIIK